MKSLLTLIALSAWAMSLATAEPVQWSVAEGGNGHYYDIIQGGVSGFGAAQELANAMSYFGLSGHLATITNQSEDTWIRENLVDLYVEYGSTIFIGGWDKAAWFGYGWRWVTEEEWDYTGWTSGEPSGGESVLSVKAGLGWNDVPYSYHASGYIVEYDEMPVTFRPLYNPLPDNPLQWSHSEGGNGHYYELVYEQVADFYAAQIAANSRSYEGLNGHLATLTGQLEDEWVRVTILNPYYRYPGTIFMGGWDDSFWSGAGWRWITQEVWDYTGWAAGEPTGGESVLSYRAAIGWNNVEFTYSSAIGYLVEYDDMPYDILMLEGPIQNEMSAWGAIKLLYAPKR